MRKTLIAIAAAAAMVPAGAWAKPHHQITDAPPDGTEWCVKSGKGMTQAQIDAWYAEEAKKLVAEDAPNDKNCMRELDDFKRVGVWYGAPSEEDCRPFAAESIAAPKAAVKARQEAFDARLHARVHHTLNEEIMKQCNQMSDTPDWAKDAALRGITVSLDDCAKAAAGLAAEFDR